MLNWRGRHGATFVQVRGSGRVELLNEDVIARLRRYQPITSAEVLRLAQYNEDRAVDLHGNALGRAWVGLVAVECGRCPARYLVDTGKVVESLPKHLVLTAEGVRA